MTSGTASDFREAARHERELNERQHEILRLVEAGHTNREIADMLGLSVDGAKWNVSEILTKLGLESREKAADYWRWRQAGVWARVRGWLGAPMLKLAGVGAATVLGVGVVAALSSEDEPPVANEPGRPFYLEADLAVTSHAESIGTNPAGTAPSRDPDVTRSTLRWSWQDVDHSRYEIETVEPAVDSGVFLVVADGSKQWIYREQEATYYEDPLYPLPDGFRVRPIGISIILGTIAWRDDIDTVDEFITLFNEDGRLTARIHRMDTHLGRPVKVVTWGPVGCSSTTTWDATGSQSSSDECGGSSELWIDEERMMVLRYVVTDDGQSIDASVTRLDYDTEFEAERFKFDPPPGATREQDDSSNSSSGSISLNPDGTPSDPPPGFLRLGRVPQGYGVRGVSQDDSAIDQEFRGPNDLEFTVSQRKRTMPEALKVGEEHEARGLTRYSTTLENGWTRVAWQEAGVTVVLEAESMPLEQLLAIAGSMSVVE